jgi:magnesium transporter
MPDDLDAMSKKVGLRPGSIVYVGESKAERPAIRLTRYDTHQFTDVDTADLEKCFPIPEPPSITWIHVNGVHDESIVERIAEHLNLYALVPEDIVNTTIRPKIEETAEFLFVVVKEVIFDPEKREIKTDQISVILKQNVIVSFQEGGPDAFGPVRERLKQVIPRDRFTRPDYLAYSLIDTVVDRYFIMLESIGDVIEDVETEVIAHPGQQNLEVIYDLKRQLTEIRRTVRALREVAYSLERSESPMIHSKTRKYHRDLLEHVLQVVDQVESYRETISGLVDIHLSSVSNRMNEVMKVLTVIATIFIPLSFLAGVYGMNFDHSISPYNMPELTARYGYPIFWFVVLGVVGLLLWYFRRKSWI